MAQSGYGYDPLQSFHSQAPYTHQPYPMYPAPPYHANGSAQTTLHNEAAAQESYNHNRSVIPGLGLGFSSNGASWQNPWAASHSGSSPSCSQRNGLSEAALLKDATLEENRKPIAPTAGIPNDDTVEEGEVSESELEDIYEPRGVEDTVDLTLDSEGNQYDTAAGDADIGNITDGPSASYSAGRDRSGSYSPYLSPREIGQQLPANNREGARNGTTVRASSPLVTSNGTRPSSPSAGTNQYISESLHVKTVAEARKQAQDAILRLWPLNVRYKNYLDEGIDEALLGSLFKELGFEVGISTTMEVPTPSRDNETNSSTTPEKAATATSGNQEPESSAAKPVRASTQDKSEERKDRIARLLAAKNSKPSNSTPIPVSIPTPTPASAPMSKTQSEKSKLLHQKMEALRKAREARGQKRPHPDESTTPNAIATSNASTPLGPVTESPLDVAGSHELPPPQGQNSGATRSPSGQPPPPIPGLFLSPTSQPPQLPTPLIQERPNTSSLSDPSDRPFKRPFGQARESRPFLIDVSDDEDDAEMDLDSPERHSLPAQRPATPLKTSFRGVSSLADHAQTRQYSSPILTPPGMVSDSSARDDLENMNKKIEAMKRKIAEAEARKKAKLSRQDSPTLPPTNSHSGDDNSEAAAVAKELIIPIVSSAAADAQCSRSSTQPISDASPERLPKVSDRRHQGQEGERRNRSRVASERLPLLEARRLEQQLKLRLLQSQVASIEKEIEESLQEEKRLRNVVATANSDSEPLPVETPNLPETAGGSPPTEAMDITTTSSATSDDARCRRDTTPGQAQLSAEQSVTDVMGSSEHIDFEEDELVDFDADASGLATVTVNQESIVREESAQEEADNATSDAGQDTAMEEAGDSNDADLEDASDSYEPPGAESSNSSRKSSRASTPFSPAPIEQGVVLDTGANNVQESTADFPTTQQISTGQQDSASEAGREDDRASEVPASDAPRTTTTFVPYETPLQYFRAYRYHPEFNQSVTGGLRSLTYSNKIDVNKELCPDELAGRSCPRGNQCEYQHFENMQAPDDQILLQLGACGNYDERQKQEYIAGLRHLLTDFRNRKVKDFQTISQGIIDYRAQFLGDKSKILPLGNVTL